MEKLIFHVDVNSAFLSWEAAKRVAAGEEDLRLIPSAIGGDREKRTGVILAKSIPAKKFGVKTGEPVGMALRKCPDLYLARPDFKLYEKNSRAFMDICRRYAPVVEKYSIDECFLDMSGTSLIYPDPVEIAHTIKDTIRDELGFTVNVAISRNKLLAKMTSDFEKPDKVHTLFPEEVPSKMWPMPVRELFSVGRATAERLETANIRTIGELAAMEPERAQFLLGNKLGAMLLDYANGRDDTPVLAEREEAKGYSNSTTLETDVTDFEQANVILLALSDSVAARMRADNAKAYCVSVTARSNDFKTRSHQKKLDEATDITSEIYEIVKLLFAELWDGTTPLRLLGVAVSDITKEDYVQQSLFFDEKKDKARKIDKAVDNIRGRYGTDIISRGSSYGSSVRVGSKHKAQIELENENKE
ncbi:MAG: DNA polymerase IV [Oscillospiraceae bacterium]|nr:DNA polymerase IV [Oscillospiraceae bacterium]